ncbi:telomere length regulation protein tel2 [Plasmopara halstedii]|uniref:Telomere length regulation protein tel2 n=1 Tax=Plasmopara halstedii TaxID=4781 RepID=A0A0P1APU2_PLAHL|nr:telomere length regulation protein tel2 [Plasmopara halstedii]CEG43305.1 telomere length regulation protein tel2 [Plasmopara halstedii]|eukprot:XP_024579674.1 telomere length regulation protein tel2 [Plasmopara halstedii]
MTTIRADMQQLRAFIDAKKRGIEDAEKRYDVQTAVYELRNLAAPLQSLEQFSPTWKSLYIDFFYRDVTAFLLRFVTVHLEACFSEQDREQAFDIFFDRAIVPSSKAIGALVSTLSATKISAHAAKEREEDDVEATTVQCIRLLEKAVSIDGVLDIVTEMIMQEQQLTTRNSHSVIGHQVLISQLASLPDLIYNRRQRNTPAAFYPQRYFPMLCDCLFLCNYSQGSPGSQSNTFRMFFDKLTRIGQAQALVQSWLRSIDTNLKWEMSACLFQSVPESAYEHLLLHIADVKTPNSLSAQQALRLSKYRLLAHIPSDVCSNKHFQYVVVHKLLLRKPISDFFFWRVLADIMTKGEECITSSALAAVFDLILTRWSQSDFAVSTEYTVNASVCFFLRYSLQKLSDNGMMKSYIKQDWITKLCKGIQDHMSHSLERVRALGMRVGESLSHIIASEKPLDFELVDQDPLAVYGCPVLYEQPETGLTDLKADERLNQEAKLDQNSSSRQKHSKHRSAKPYTLDPDELVLSDDGDEENSLQSDRESGSCLNDADSDSDMSLEAYDLEDDEEDLTAKRPLYLKDLIAGLLSDDNRERTEVALNEAEVLLRRTPRDLKDKAHDVVRALLRLENKYKTPQFVKLRLQALATACALAPTQTLPYLCSQALEREQLLQSRIDVLQAMITAAQELSQRGGGKQYSNAPKTLLREQVGNDLETRTMQSLKTRRWGYRRDPLVAPTKNAFAPYALQFFSPLLFGYVQYMQKFSDNFGKARSEIEQMFLAHLLHALANFVECAGHSTQTVAMAKCLLEFSWSERSCSSAEVRRQVLFSISRVLLVVSPTLLQREVGDVLVEIAPWLHQVQNHDPDAGCREAARMLNTCVIMPEASISLSFLS